MLMLSEAQPATSARRGFILLLALLLTASHRTLARFEFQQSLCLVMIDSVPSSCRSGLVCRARRTRGDARDEVRREHRETETEAPFCQHSRPAFAGPRVCLRSALSCSQHHTSRSLGSSFSSLSCLVMIDSVPSSGRSGLVCRARRALQRKTM